MDRWTVRDWPREKCFLERGGGEKDNKSKQGAPPSQLGFPNLGQGGVKLIYAVGTPLFSLPSLTPHPCDGICGVVFRDCLFMRAQCGRDWNLGW